MPPAARTLESPGGILSQAKPLGQGAGFAARIRARLEQPHEGVSVGIWAAAGRAAPGDTSDLLFRRTDRAMVAVTQNRWSELVIAPPAADETTWYERPIRG